MEVDSKSPADAGSHAGSKSRAVVNHREMLALPALKILADPDHSEKSLLVLMSVMDRCCEPGNQAVFIGARDREEDQSVGLGNFNIVNVLNVFCANLRCFEYPCSFHKVVPRKIFCHFHKKTAVQSSSVLCRAACQNSQPV